jgi:hypothetical protein
MERIVVSTKRGGGGARRGLQRLATLVLLAGVAACESTTTSPRSLVELDTEAALSDYETLARVLSTQGFAGFLALEGRTPFGERAGVSAVAGLDPRAGDSPRSFALRLMESLRQTDASAGGPAAAPLLSGRFLGKTFVYDPALDEYVVDPDRTGAPANGVRFILYQVDAQDRPRGTEIGYADLLDEGAGSATGVKLRWVVAESGKTVLDYRTSVDGTDGDGRITVDGFVVDDSARLDFSVDVRGRRSGGKELLDMDFDLRVDSRQFRVTGEVRGMEDGDGKGSGSVVVAVKHQAHSLRLELDGTPGAVNGSIAVDGELFATISGDPDHPDVKGASGGPVTAEEATVVLAVVQIVDDVFTLVEDLVEPVHSLLALGWIL